MSHRGPRGALGPTSNPGTMGIHETSEKYWPKWLKNINDFIWDQSLKDAKIQGIVVDLGKLIEFWEENKYENPFK